MADPAGPHGRAAGAEEPPLVLLAAGGTGGHLFPAEALSHALTQAGLRVALVTDLRAIEFAGGFPAEIVRAVPSATPSGRSLLARIEAAWRIGKGVLAARRLIRELDPAIVVGFGGYPTVPPILAATMLGVPTLIHEQNAVVGRANRFLSGRVGTIATGFEEVGGLKPSARAKCVHVGNPVRPAVIHAARTPFRPAEPGGPLEVVIFGGSQGARVMADVAPPAIEQLSAAERARLVITQQARLEDDSRVQGTYARVGVRAEVASFFKDLPSRMASAHLVISRSGASTVAELSVIGRPSLLVPLPGALDQDQAANARTLGDRGAATVIPQAEFTPNRLAAELRRVLADPASLTAQAAAARAAGIPDGAERLARLVRTSLRAA
jgi:UDP-N-acetylglucosamine--N-acetylmuramyl-(pentapeptide) pyrophosphoryl-undecaprenol N-acetylglucosamine transferase